MYNGPLGGSCSALIHLLLRYPIFVVVLGLGGAVAALLHSTPPEVALAELNVTPAAEAMLAEATDAFSTLLESPQVSYDPANPDAYFAAIIRARGSTKNPAGLTPVAVREVLRKIPDCTNLNVRQVLRSPEVSTKIAYLYFLDLVHQFGNVEQAVIAYHHGPKTVKKRVELGRALPGLYLTRVKAHLG